MASSRKPSLPQMCTAAPSMLPAMLTVRRVPCAAAHSMHVRQTSAPAPLCSAARLDPSLRISPVPSSFGMTMQQASGASLSTAVKIMPPAAIYASMEANSSRSSASGRPKEVAIHSAFEIRKRFAVLLCKRDNFHATIMPPRLHHTRQRTDTAVLVRAPTPCATIPATDRPSQRSAGLLHKERCFSIKLETQRIIIYAIFGGIAAAILFIAFRT